MNKLYLFIYLFLFQLSLKAELLTDSLQICNLIYTVKASITTKHGVSRYSLAINGNGISKRILQIGIIKNQNSKEAILQTLKDSLHKADIFAPCPGQASQTDQNIDDLINTLISEVFPYSHVNPEEKVINDNNKLRLLQESSNNSYQLVYVHGQTRVTLVAYDQANRTYIINWVNFNTIIIDNFDMFLSLYFKIPPTAEKPILYLMFQSQSNNYQMAYSYNGHTAITSPVYLTKEVSQKLSKIQSQTLIIAPNTSPAALLKIIDPLSSEATKKPKDEPKLNEE